MTRKLSFSIVLAVFAVLGFNTIAAAQTATTDCYAFTTNLQKGDSGAAVTALQAALEKDGEFVPSTGFFWNQTAAAVTAFQEKYATQVLVPSGLTRGTGYVGAATRNELNASYGCGNVTPVVPSPKPAATSTASSTVQSAPLSLISPNGEDVFVQGAANDISWTGSGPATVSLFDYSGTTFMGTIMSGITSSTSYVWNGETICDSFVAGVGMHCLNILPGPYRIAISNGTKDIVMSKNIFAIVAPPASY